MYIVHTIKELLGPRPLCRVVGVLSLNRSSGIAPLAPFRSKTNQLSELWGSGGTVTPPTPSPPTAGVASALKVLI